MRLRRVAALACALTMLGSGVQYDKVNTYAAEWSIAVTEENFPDAALRKYLLDTIDINEDNIISQTELTKKVGLSINIPTAGIKDITGLEKLNGVETIMVSDNPIEHADLSNYIGITSFDIYSPVLKTLNVSNSTITDVIMGSRHFNKVEWGNKSKYKYISITYSGYKEFNLKEFTNIESFFMDETDIKELDTTSNNKLYKLFCGGSQIYKLDVSKNLELGMIGCGGSHLQELDLSNNSKVDTEYLNTYAKRSKTKFDESRIYAQQQVYFVATKNQSGKYSITLDGIKDSTRIKNTSSGTQSGNVISWNDLLTVPSTFSYKYDTKCPKNEYVTSDVYLDVNVNVVRPANPKAVSIASNGSVTVSWFSEQTEDDKTWEVPVSYEVYRSTSENGTYSKIATVADAATSYTDTTTKKGKTYFYKVKTVKDTYKGKLTSEFGEAVEITIAPEMVKIGAVTQSGTNSAVVEWEAAEGATEYDVYRSESINGEYSKIATVDGLSYTDTGLTCGKTYSYKVISRSGNVAAEAYSSIFSVQIRPLSPTGLKVTQNKTNITISYNKSEWADGYEIYSSKTKDGGYKLIKTTSELKYVDTTEYKYGDECFYKVRAYKNNGSLKVYSDYTSVKGTNLTPGAVENKKISASAYNKLKLSWDKMPGVDGYEIRRSEKASGTYTKIADVTAVSYTDTVTCGKTYYYKVVPYMQEGSAKEYADAGNYIGGKTAPNVGNISSVSRSEYNKLKISYAKGAGATGYEIYRATSKNGSYTKVGTSTGTSYTDTVKCGTTYYYKVRSYAKTDSGTVYSASYSNIVSGKSTLSKPTIKLTAGSKKATVNITKVTGAGGYEIYMSTKKDSGYKKIKTVTSKTLKYTKGSLTKGKKYYFKVKAYIKVNDKKVYSAYSAVKSVKVK